MPELVVPLYRIAHSRTGDKGDRSNISVIAWKQEFYPLLVRQLLPERVEAQLCHRNPTRVQRFLLPRLRAMNFVVDHALDGGVNGALNLDAHGKSLSYLVLKIEVSIPSELAGDCVGPPH